MLFHLLWLFSRNSYAFTRLVFLLVQPETNSLKSTAFFVSKFWFIVSARFLCSHNTEITMKYCSAILLLLYSVSLFAQPASTKRKVDICIYGGTSAGVIAAYSAKKLGKSVILVEPGNHLGGMTSGGLSATDIGNKMAITGLSRDFFRRLGNHYGKFEHWLPEPKVAEKIFQDYIKEANAEVVYGYRLNHVQKTGTVITQAVFESTVKGAKPNLTIEAAQFMDCTYEGDLMAQAGVSFFIGRESNALYNETLSGVQLQDRHQFEDGIDPYKVKGDPASGFLWGISPLPVKPNGVGDRKVQAYNFRLCMTYDSLNRMPVPKPDNYDPSKYELLLRLMEARAVKGWKHVLKTYFLINEIPNKKADWNNMGAFSTDHIGANWNYPEAGYEERARIWKDHEDYQKGLLYFVANDPRVLPEVQREMRKWGLPKDEFTDNGGWPHQLYVREARRMIGEYVMTEHNCRGSVTASDAIGMAAYTMDSHNCDRHLVNGMVKNEGNVEVGGFPPYPIAYRSITPKREECTNLTVPVCMSATHIAYGSIRMEPVFMVLAQSATMAAAMAIDKKIPVQQIDVTALQAQLKNDPLLNGNAPEILVDDALTPQLISYEGNWDGKPKTKIYPYGPSLKSAENKPGNAATFTVQSARAATYKLMFYSSKFYAQQDLDSLSFTITVGKKSQKKSVSNLEVAALSSNDNKGFWMNLGTVSLKAGETCKVKVQGDGKQEGFIPADALLAVPVGK